MSSRTGAAASGAAGVSVHAAVQSGSITARQIVERIRKELGADWKDSELDVFCAGDPETRVTGIATSFAASMDVLQRAADEKKNMLIVREHPFYSHGSLSYFRVPQEQISKDPVCIAKKKFIEDNGLVVWRFTENWQSRKVDGQLLGLARALQWEGYHRSKSNSGGKPFHKGDAFFMLPEITLRNCAVSISEKLKIGGTRVIGDPEIPVRKAALSTGLIRVAELAQLLQEPAVDAVIVGEPVEWEASPYFEDVIASGQKKGMIILGQAVSEDPGSGEAARWLSTFVLEVSVKWLPAGDPFWMLKPLKRV